MSKELIKTEGRTEIKRRKTIALLWGLLLVSIILDSFHCNILALIYNCKVGELLYVSDFYFLSPIFGLVDLAIALIILKKSRVEESIQYCIMLYEKNQITIPVIKHIAQIFLAIFVAGVSICSLIVDVIKFFA